MTTCGAYILLYLALALLTNALAMSGHSMTAAMILPALMVLKTRNETSEDDNEDDS